MSTPASSATIANRLSTSTPPAARSLGVYAVPVSVDGLSFLGVVFPTPVISRVRIHIRAAHGTPRARRRLAQPSRHGADASA
jgi:hypothetical protein